MLTIGYSICQHTTKHPSGYSICATLATTSAIYVACITVVIPSTTNGNNISHLHLSSGYTICHNGNNIYH